MLAVIVSVCASICAIVYIRYYALKTRLTEKSIDEAIARRLQASPLMAEVRDLRELNAVMRNLLIDIVEAEDMKPQSAIGEISQQERKRLVSIRETRRREIYAEALVVLRQADVSAPGTTVERAHGNQRPNF